jgi:hypothetical protein
MLTDKQIFDAIRERRGVGFEQTDVDAINRICTRKDCRGLCSSP